MASVYWLGLFFFGEYVSIDIDCFKKFDFLIGCDEVGRGPIAGPVNACAVQLNKNSINIINKLIDIGVTDSKKLAQKRRLKILNQLGIHLEALKINKIYKIELNEGELSFMISQMSPAQIDKRNILQASLACMQNSSEKLMQENSIVLVDGNKTFKSSARHIETVIKGDSKSAIIGLASIIAKEYRDRLMEKLDKKYPGYGFAQHSGYPTVAHKEAVAKLGVTSIHRKTFKGVKEYLGQ